MFVTVVHVHTPIISIRLSDGLSAWGRIYFYLLLFATIKYFFNAWHFAIFLFKLLIVLSVFHLCDLTFIASYYFIYSNILYVCMWYGLLLLLLLIVFCRVYVRSDHIFINLFRINNENNNSNNCSKLYCFEWYNIDFLNLQFISSRRLYFYNNSQYLYHHGIFFSLISINNKRKYCQALPNMKH